MFPPIDNIVLVLDNNLRINGGTELSTKNLLHFGFKAGVKWTVMSPFNLPSNVHADEIILKGEKILKDSPYHYPSNKELKSVIKLIEKKNPGLIVFTTPNYYMYHTFQSLPNKFKARSIILWRMQADMTPTHLLKEVLGQIKGKRDYHKELIGLRQEMASSVIRNLAVSESVARSLKRLGIKRSKIRVIPTQVGGEFSSFLRLYDKKLRGNYLKPNQLGILGVGRLVPGKGWDLMLEIYKNLRKNIGQLNQNSQFKEIKISIAGGKFEGNPYFEYLQKLQGKVEQETNELPGINKITLEWLGDTSWDELQKLYNAYDLGFALMGRKEAFGRITVEALSSGLPLIGNSECLNTKDILNSAPYPIGKLISSPEEAVEVVLDLMINKENIEQMQFNSSLYASKVFTLDNAERKWWEALGGLINQNQLLSLNEQSVDEEFWL